MLRFYISFFLFVSLSFKAEAKLKCVKESDLTFKGHFGANNEQGLLTWGQSYYLLVYIKRYQYTRDQDLLAEFVLHADEVLKQRDDRRSYASNLPVWSSLRYSSGVPFAGPVSSGMISFPIAKFVEIVVSDPKIIQLQTCDGRILGDVAKRYLSAIEETVKHHEQQWNDKVSGYRAPPSSKEYFRTSDKRFGLAEFDSLPLNMTHALGRTILTLYRITGKRKYLDRTTAIALRFKSLLTKGSGAFTWKYWPSFAGGKGRVEDASHGAISVEFASMCEREGIVFRKEDMLAFANTLLRNMQVQPGGFSYFVDGTRELKGTQKYFPCLWAPLARYDPKVEVTLKEYLKSLKKENKFSILARECLVSEESEAVWHK